MRVALLTAVSAAGLLTSSCGGGGRSGPSTGSPPPAPTPTLAVTLSKSSADLTVAEGETASFGFSATYTGSSSDPDVPDLAVNGKRYSFDGTPTASGQKFDVAFKTADFAPGGSTTSTVTFRLCKSSYCSTVYPESTPTFTVNLDVQLKDWGTFQHNPAHTGYVAASYKTADFASAWSMPMTSLAPTGVAATSRKVFVNFRQIDGHLLTSALGSSDGKVKWSYDLGSMSYSSPPSYGGGRVVSMAMNLSSGSIPMQILDGKTGKYLKTLTYDSQFSSGGTPTPFGDSLYFQAGYFGIFVFAANAAQGLASWRTDTTLSEQGYVQEGETLAVDNDYVYYFGGGNLFLLSRNDGSIVKTIANPFFTMAGSSYFGTYYGPRYWMAPVVYSNSRTIAEASKPHRLRHFLRQVTNRYGARQQVT